MNDNNNNNGLKQNLVNELKRITDEYVLEVKQRLEAADIVYSCKHDGMLNSIPFRGQMPEICDDMVEDLFMDLVDNWPVGSNLYTRKEVEDSLREYEERKSPKNRILRHMSEIKRLKEKYKVSDEDLKNSMRISDK